MLDYDIHKYTLLQSQLECRKASAYSLIFSGISPTITLATVNLMTSNFFLEQAIECPVRLFAFSWYALSIKGSCLQRKVLATRQHCMVNHENNLFFLITIGPEQFFPITSPQLLDLMFSC